MLRPACAVALLGAVLSATMTDSARADEPPVVPSVPPASAPSVSGPPTVPQPPPACVPGAQVQCACLAGTLGVQVCAATGDRFESCRCSDAATPGGVRPMVKRSQAGVTNGLALTIVGGVAFVVGTSWLFALYASNQDSSCTNQDDSTTKCLIAGGVGFLGAVGLAAGIPMMIINGEMVPAPAKATSMPWWAPKSVAVSRSGAQALWTF